MGALLHVCSSCTSRHQSLRRCRRPAARGDAAAATNPGCCSMLPHLRLQCCSSGVCGALGAMAVPCSIPAARDADLRRGSVWRAATRQRHKPQLLQYPAATGASIEFFARLNHCRMVATCCRRGQRSHVGPPDPFRSRLRAPAFHAPAFPASRAARCRSSQLHGIPCRQEKHADISRHRAGVGCQR